MLDLKAIAGDRYRITLDESAKLDPERAARLWYYRIPCKYGHIAVWGAGKLSAWTDRRLMISRLEFLEGMTVVQRGDREITVTFPLNRLDAVAELLHARKRRQVSEEQKAVLADRLARFKAVSSAQNVSATAQDDPRKAR